MTERTRHAALDAFGVVVGEWEMTAEFPGMDPVGGATATFEWMEGGMLLVQRWQVPIPEAPDGIAVYGYDEGRGSVLQHYFDTRGVVRLYEASIEGGTWTLERRTGDFSPLEFGQRFIGKIAGDGTTIEGTWQIADDNETFEKDFEMTYRKVA